MKIAVAVGSARRFVAGDPDIQLMDVLAGRLIDAQFLNDLPAGIDPCGENGEFHRSMMADDIDSESEAPTTS